MSQPIQRLLSAAALLVVTLGLSSCAGFFICQKASCPTSTSTTTNTNDLGYVTNSASGNAVINGYALSSGTLLAATSSPYSLGFVPSAMAVSRANTFLYVASSPLLYSSNAAIYGYTIGAAGAITQIGSSALLSEGSVALETSPDGRYLFSLNGTGLTLDQFSINATSGALTFVTSVLLGGSSSGGTVVPYALRFAPSGNFLVATYQLGGAQVFSYSYNSTTGSAVSSTTILNPRNSTDAFYGVDIDSNNYIYTASTAGLSVYSATSAGAATLVNTGGAYTSGTGGRSVVVNAAGNYVYAADSNGSQIYGFSIASGGALTAISGSPFPAPPAVSVLGRDNSGDYLLAEGYSATSGIQLFSIGSAGALTSTNAAANGASTGVSVALALTH